MATGHEERQVMEPARVAIPSVGWLISLGLASVLVPGVVVFLIFRLVGLGTGSAGLLGLLAMLLSLVIFPLYLRGLGRRLDG